MKNMCRSLEVPNHQLFDALLLCYFPSTWIRLGSRKSEDSSQVPAIYEILGCSLGFSHGLTRCTTCPRPRWRQRLQSAQNMIVKCHHLQHLQNLQLIDPDHPLLEGSCLVFVVFYWHIWLLETQRIDGIRSADAAFPLRGRYASHGGLPGRVRRYMEILCFTVHICSAGSGRQD